MDVVACTAVRTANNGYIDSGRDFDEVARLEFGPVAANELTLRSTSSKLKDVNRVAWGKVPFVTHASVITIVLKVARKERSGCVWSSLQV